MVFQTVALQCCEKLSQQIKDIWKEASLKTDEQTALQLKTETTRLKANKLRDVSPDLALRLVESELYIQACHTACREIEAVRQGYRENWRRTATESDQNKVIKDLDLEQNKLIQLEVKLEKIRKERKDRPAPRLSRVPTLINQFATILSRLKSSADKLDMIKRRYDMVLSGVAMDGSQLRFLLEELRARSQNRLKREQRMNERQREMSTANLVNLHMSRIESMGTQNEHEEEGNEDLDEDILKERLMSESETNKQLEGLCVCTHHWLLQEEEFEKAVETLEDTTPR